MEIIVVDEETIPEFWVLRLKALLESPEAFGRSYSEESAKPFAEVFEHFKIRLKEPGNIILAAEENNKLVGIVGLSRQQGAKDNHKSFIWGMWVEPEFRGLGFGKLLMLEAINQARLMPGVEMIQLTVVTTRKEARNLYSSLGFVQYGLELRALKTGSQYWDEDLMVLFL